MAEFMFDCPVCGVSIETDDSLRGSTVQCPECSNFIAIPNISLNEGMVLGDFTVERRLGVGGMGEVWLATQRTLDRKVALKVLSPNFTKDPEFVSRFLQEVKMAGRLSHPNIVTAYGAGFDRGMHYLALEYVDGVELGNRMRMDSLIPEIESLRIARKIADALRYAWTKFKILHRDIKPANIMISVENEPKLMDMGISKSVAEDSSLTMTGVIVGTPYYMSPEQAKADKSIDFRADIYSLGATIYHLSTGSVPFDGPTAMAIISRHMSDSLQPPKERNQNLSDRTARLIEKMMAKSKEARHSSWDEVIAELDGIIEGRPAPDDPTVILPPPSHDSAAFPSSTLPGASSAVMDQSKGCFRRFFIPVAIAVAVFMALSVAAILAPHSFDKAEKEKRAQREREMEQQIKDREASIKEDARRKAEADRVKVRDEAASRRLEMQWEYASSTAQNAINRNHGFEVATGILDKFIADASGSQDMTAKAGDLKSRLMDAKADASKSALESLVSNAKPLLESNNFSAAAALMRGYSGEFKEETKDERERLASEYVSMMPSQPPPNQGNQGEEMMREAFARASDALMTGREAEAADILGLAARKPELKDFSENFKAASSLCSQLANADSTIIDAFSKEAGKEISLEISGRKMPPLKLYSIKNGMLLIGFKEAKGIVARTVPLSSLGIDDRASRLSSADLKALYYGLEMVKRRKWDQARESFSKAGSMAEPMRGAIDRALNPTKPTTSRSEYTEKQPETARDINSVLHGKIVSFDPNTSDIEMLYDFNDTGQMQDWIPLIHKTALAAEINHGKMLLESHSPASFELRPKFSELHVKSRVSFSGNGIFQGIARDNNNNIAMVVSGFMSNQDGYYIRTDIENPGTPENKYERIRDSKFKSNRTYDTDISFESDKVEFSVDGKRDWPILHLNADQVSLRIGVIDAKNEYFNLKIKGRLSRKWYEHVIVQGMDDGHGKPPMDDDNEPRDKRRPFRTRFR